MPYKGKFTLIHPEKYKGNPHNIIYRSIWERNCMRTFDSSSNVLAWASEESFIPYVSPVDQKVHKYFPDFLVKVLDKNKQEKKYMIEVKPYKFTQPPKITKRKTKSYYNAVERYAINLSKWEAAKNWCIAHDYIFKLMTETECMR